MTKRNKRRYGVSRRLGVNLWGRAKDPVSRKNFPPGQHGLLGYKKLTDHGVQLQAKQKLKKYYGDITERQFRKVYKEAARRKGDTSENLVGLLESRLDAIVYRANIVPTIFAARQFVNHGHVKINGRRITIPSYTVKPGQIIEVSDKAKQMILVVEMLQSKDRSVPSYLEVDTDKVVVKFLRMPALSEIPYPVVMEPNLVIEFYSK